MANPVLEPEYWRRLCPELHCCDYEFQQSILVERPKPCKRSVLTAAKHLLVEEGFSIISSESISWSVSVSQLAAAVLKIREAGHPPTAIAAFDETWALGRDASAIMGYTTGNLPVMDVLSFVVDPGCEGFSPHRDRQPEDWVPRGFNADVSETFKPDGAPKYATCWMALSDASPDNSCLHYLPAEHDPGYYGGDPEDGDPMSIAFPDKEAFQNIRAAPMSAGGCVMHSHRVIHWGNKGRRGVPPRVSLSFSFSDPKFEPPYLSTDLLPFPEMRARMALVAAQVINYSSLSTTDKAGWEVVAGSGGVQRLEPTSLSVLHRCFYDYRKHFHASYQREIAAKFLALTAGSAHTGTNDSDEDEDDIIDSALEMMLDADTDDTNKKFHDDFDVANCLMTEVQPMPIVSVKQKMNAKLKLANPKKKKRRKDRDRVAN